MEDFFTNKLDISQDPYFDEISGLEVSAHLLIKRSGDVVQFVPFDKRAWHAGESSYKGESDCNNFSIGIELEGTDTDEFEDRQYEILSEIIKVLKSSYAIEDVVGHSDIAPGRKTDPGSGFNWNRIHELI
jgi:AmpD protein